MANLEIDLELGEKRKKLGGQGFEMKKMLIPMGFHLPVSQTASGKP